MNDNNRDEGAVRPSGDNEDHLPQPGDETSPGDGKIPAELRGWFQECFPPDGVVPALDEVNLEAYRELSEFLDLSEWERLAANEPAKHKR